MGLRRDEVADGVTLRKGRGYRAVGLWKGEVTERVRLRRGEVAEGWGYGGR